MDSAAEAEIGGIFLNCQEALPIQNILSELGHLQLATPLKTDNATTSGIANNTIHLGIRICRVTNLKEKFLLIFCWYYIHNYFFCTSHYLHKNGLKMTGIISISN